MNTTVTDASRSEAQQQMDWLKGLAAPLLIPILAMAGQWLITQPEASLIAGAACFASSLALFLWILAGWPRAALPAPPAQSVSRRCHPVINNREVRVSLAVGAAILAGAAFLGFEGNHLMGGLWLWLGAILLFLLAFVEVPDFKPGGWKQAAAGWWHDLDKRVLVILLAIMLLAIFFRVYRLNTVPAETTSDHAEKLLDVRDVLDGARPIFFPRNTGREALQFYVTAFLVRFTPLQLNHLALKVGTALFGILAIPFTYLVSRDFFGRVVGLLAAFFLAISHWHVAITRVGLRCPFTAAFATPALIFLFRAFRTNHRNDWLLSALFVGIGLHTYTAMRIVPFLFVVLVGLELSMDGWQVLRKRSVSGTSSWNDLFCLNAILGGLFSILLVSPLLRIIIDDPKAFWLRTLSRTQSETTPTPAELWGVLLGNIENALLMFNLRGDVVPVNTIPGSPVMGIVSAAMFALGISYLLWRLVLHRDRRALYVLVTLFVLILPSILSLTFPGENPSVVRSGGAVPWAMMIAALPLAIIIARLGTLPSRSGRIVALLLLAILAAIAVVYNFEWYFVRYDANIRRSLWNATEMGTVLRDFVDEGGDPANAYHVSYPWWVDTRNIGISAGFPRWANAIGSDGWRSDLALGDAPQIYILFPDDVASLRRLVWLFPRGQIEVFNSRWEGKDFVIFRVP
jgi:hypothetical protein